MFLAVVSLMPDGMIAVLVRDGFNRGFRRERLMLKWLVVVALVVLVTGLMQPGSAWQLRLGQLPGDVHFRFRGRAYHFPFTTTVLLSLVVWLILRSI